MVGQSERGPNFTFFCGQLVAFPLGFDTPVLSIVCKFFSMYVIDSFFLLFFWTFFLGGFCATGRGGV
jgi:hypothetical protein